MIDSDEMTTFGPMGEKVWNMYSRVSDVVDIELMNFTEDELKMVSVLYADNLIYPIHSHVAQLMTGTPEDEVLH